MIFRAKPAVIIPEMSTAERSVSIVIGLVLAAASLRPRPNRLLSVLALATGSYLAYRGATGHCPATERIDEVLHPRERLR